MHTHPPTHLHTHTLSLSLCHPLVLCSRKSSSNQVDRDLDAITKMADLLTAEESGGSAVQARQSGAGAGGDGGENGSTLVSKCNAVTRSPSNEEQEMFKAFDAVMSSKISTLSRNQGELLNRLMEGESDSFAPEAPRGKVRTKNNCPVPGTLRVHKKGELLLKRSGTLSSSWKKCYVVLVGDHSCACVCARCLVRCVGWLCCVLCGDAIDSPLCVCVCVFVCLFALPRFLCRMRKRCTA
jgi:hypothetical protein